MAKRTNLDNAIRLLMELYKQHGYSWLDARREASQYYGISEKTIQQEASSRGGKAPKQRPLTKKQLDAIVKELEEDEALLREELDRVFVKENPGYTKSPEELYEEQTQPEEYGGITLDELN